MQPVTHTEAGRGAVARSELVLGGQKSGKSRRAETRAQDWLAAAPDHEAVLIATAWPGDDEMRERISRHQRDRARRVPGLRTQELHHSLALSEVLLAHSQPRRMVLVDCLTLWLTRLLMPPPGHTPQHPDAVQTEVNRLCQALAIASGPVLLVGNEIGLGVIPLGREVRAFVDALGQLNQAVAAQCTHVTLMAAGLPLTLKGAT